MKKTIIAAILALTPTLASAQATSFDHLTPPFPTAGERKAADIVSTVSDGVLITLDTIHAFRSENPKRALMLEGIRVGATYGGVFGLKTLFHRDRPCSPDCGQDNAHFSLPSGHTALACSTIGGPSLMITVPLSGGVGWLRILADKHYLTDVLAGCAVGALTSRIR